MRYICTRNRMIARALSSVGSEHLVYTQRVGGSNPSAPTERKTKTVFLFLFSPIVFLFLKIRTKEERTHFFFYR